MGFPLNDLGQALTNQIYQTVMGGDDKVKPPADTFFTWCMPGLALTDDDLDFAGSGIYSATTAEDMKKRLLHAFNLAMLFDFIPDVGAPYSNDKQQGMYKPDAERRLSEMYRQILRFSKVLDDELTDREKEKLEKFRGLLFTTKKVTDLITDEVKEVTEESPIVKAYNEKMAAYVAAALEYNAKRIAAAAATGTAGTAAVADFSTNQQLYYLKVNAAENAWTSGGYRGEVEQMHAFIDHVTQRSMVRWKAELLDAYEKAAITSTDVPIPFRYTTLVPGNLAAAGGWTTIGVNHETVQWSKQNTSTSWKAEAGIRYGLFGFGGGASGTKTSVDEHREVESFAMSFQLAQAVIVRPWFYPEWFANRGWTLATGQGWNFDELPSDGGAPPKGALVGYPTQAIFVRDVKIKSAEFISDYHKATSEIGASGSVGWGPIKLGGSYNRATSKEDFKSTDDGKTLTVPGMQIIGFVNHLISKAPNPMPDVPAEAYV